MKRYKSIVSCLTAFFCIWMWCTRFLEMQLSFLVAMFLTLGLVFITFYLVIIYLELRWLEKFFVIRQPISLKWRIILGASSFLVLFLCYGFISYRQHLENPDDRTLPNFRQLKEGLTIIFQRQSDEIIIDTDGTAVDNTVAESSAKGVKKYLSAVVDFFRHPHDRWIVEDSIATAKRLFIGLAIGISVSLVIGVLMGCFSIIEAYFDPTFSYLSKIPPTAMVAVFFILAGLGPKMFILNIVFGILPTLSRSICLSVKEIPMEYHYKIRTFGASRMEEILKLVLSYIFPRFLNDVLLQFGPAVVYLIASELNLADIGFGYRIRIHYKLASMNIVFPYLVILGIFGLLMNFFVSYLNKKTFVWYHLREGK